MDEIVVCQCSAAGLCPRRGVAINKQQYKLCQSGKVKQLDEMFQRAAGIIIPRKSKLSRNKPRRISQEPVGSMLAKRIEGLIGVKGGSGCNCRDLAAKMDAWGISGCQLRRTEIVTALTSNRDMLVNAMRERAGIAVGFLASLVPAAVLTEGANWLLDKAIEDARLHSLATGLSRKRTRVSPGPNGIRRFIATLKKEQDRLYELMKQQAPPQPDPFDNEPVLHFGAHLWPVRGHWQWHVDLWNQMPHLISGKCFVGIATDESTDSFEEVQAALHPTFTCRQFGNTKEGENPTFRWLQEVVPHGQNDVLIYCHGKGVRPHTARSEAIRRWTQAMYQTVVFNHQMVLEQMESGYKNVHSFRTFGTRPLSPRYKWHPSGTFFAVRAKHLPGKEVQARYGGVEAWCGQHFQAHESWCEFFDNSMFTTLYDHQDSRDVVAPMLLEYNRKRRYEDQDMCSTWGRNFCRMLPEGTVEGKDILEVGSFDVNGSCRPLIMQRLPASYVGTDMQAGPGVDVVCEGENLPNCIGVECKDVIVCTEVLEHVERWFQFLTAVWSVLKPSGVLLLTTRSPGFPLHNYPADYWRFTVRDMLAIFESQEILTVTADPTSDPGVGVIVRKTCATLHFSNSITAMGKEGQ